MSKEKDEHRTSNIERLMMNEKMIDEDLILKKQLQPFVEMIFAVVESTQEYPIEGISKHDLIMNALFGIARIF